MTSHASDSIELLVIEVLCRRFKTDLSKRIRRLLRSSPGDYLALDIDVSSYSDPLLFSKDYLVMSFLRKWKGWDVGIDTRKSAIDSWTAAERQNLVTNRRLTELSLPSRELTFISKVKHKIEQVLGVAPDFEVLDRLCRWGPGATFDLRRGDAVDAAAKMSSPLTVTRRALPHLNRVFDPVWNEFRAVEPTIVRGNRCITVPKNAKTDRMIAAEPTGNSFLQQGVGRFIRRRLKAFGVDLDDQSVNQGLAFSSLVDGLSTLDLSMASDTLCRSIVDLFLPFEWAAYLEDLRSPYSLLNGKWYRLEKFSSMGNAFTFELETLIFWAICSVIVGNNGTVSAYGDDLIVPQGKYDEVVLALQYFGFTVNRDKSFKSGNFFESCGKHYHSLEDVTPAYQKEWVGKDLQELIRMHNRLYRWGVRNDMRLVKDACDEIIAFTQSKHPKLLTLPRVPLAERDDGFITNSLLLNRTKHGDYRCMVLSVLPNESYGISNTDHGMAYAYKLRHPQTLNVLTDGHYGLSSEQRTVLRSTVVWASSCKN